MNFKIQCNKLDLFKDKYCILNDSFIYWQKNKHFCYGLNDGKEIWSSNAYKEFKDCDKGFNEINGLWTESKGKILNFQPFTKEIKKFDFNLVPFTFQNNIIFDSKGNGFDIAKEEVCSLREEVCKKFNLESNLGVLRPFTNYLIFRIRESGSTYLNKVDYKGNIHWVGLMNPKQSFHNDTNFIEYTDDRIIVYDNSNLTEKFELDINLKFMSFFDDNLLFSKNTDENTREVFSYTSNGELSWARSFELPHRSNSDLYSSNSYPYLVSITGDGKGKYELVYVDNKGEDIFSETIRKPQHTRLLDNGKHLVFEGAKSFTLATYEL